MHDRLKNLSQTVYSQTVMTSYVPTYIKYTTHKHSTVFLLGVPDRQWVLEGRSDPVPLELLALPAESTEQL